MTWQWLVAIPTIAIVAAFIVFAATYGRKWDRLLRDKWSVAFRLVGTKVPSPGDFRIEHVGQWATAVTSGKIADFHGPDCMAQAQAWCDANYVIPLEQDEDPTLAAVRFGEERAIRKYVNEGER